VDLRINFSNQPWLEQLAYTTISFQTQSILAMSEVSEITETLISGVNVFIRLTIPKTVRHESSNPKPQEHQNCGLNSASWCVSINISFQLCSFI
jgi:hypothetical protein